ncbi:hypothetical protein ACH4LT_09725 [Streptomyces clavifer]|uniref:hypothetical protein n=1 Tax=Streptomyces clavifer TaxID=68188 RepID=UPI00378F6B51
MYAAPHFGPYTDNGSHDVSTLVWDGAERVDLEVIEAIPGMPDEYLALAGSGIVYRLKVTGTTPMRLKASKPNSTSEPP